ncbi:MAG: energy transducer TonB [Sphaerochaetaceae bacterium]
MSPLQRFLLIAGLTVCCILILFIPIKQKQPEPVSPPAEERTAIAMLSMDRYKLSPPDEVPEEQREPETNPPVEDAVHTEPPSSYEGPIEVQEERPEEKPLETSPPEQPSQQSTAEALPTTQEASEEPEKIEGYYAIESVTNPPIFDVSLLSSKIVYPPIAKRQGKEGTVMLRLFIGADGSIERIVIEEDPGYGMAEAALEAFTELQVQPALRETIPVPVTLVYPIRFTLQ